MGIPYALNVFGAAVTQASTFGSHAVPEYIAIFDSDMLFKHPLEALINVLASNSDVTILSGHDSIEHVASEECVIQLGKKEFVAKTKRIERGCFLLMKTETLLEFLPLPHDQPAKIDWQLMQLHPRSLGNTGRKLLCIDSSVHLGLFDSTWSVEGVPASREQVVEIVAALEARKLMTQSRYERAATYINQNNLLVDLGQMRCIPLRGVAPSRGVDVRTDESDVVTLRPSVMRPGGIAGPDFFATLPDDPAPLADDFSLMRIGTALDMACRPLETLTPSAWSRLVPVLFALVALLRPRRFVELGTHYGCSFFAANQVMKAMDLTAEAVAVDTWQGDPQAGYYGEEVFADFSHLLCARYPERAFYIRAAFDDAADCFEENSIDLLHIDGLHTYEAVRNDFETWLKKMSDRGVIVIHNTTVYERDFGVWRLWREISDRYPAVNLLHSHGLGIVYVGRKENWFSAGIRGLAADPTRYALLNSFFRSLGDLSIDEAEARQRADAAAVNAADWTAKLDKAEAEAIAVRSETAAVLASTSWRVSAPMRALSRLIRRH